MKWFVLSDGRGGVNLELVTDYELGLDGTARLFMPSFSPDTENKKALSEKDTERFLAFVDRNRISEYPEV